MNNLLNYQTKYAKLIYENGFITDSHLLELKLLAIYMRDVLKYKPKKRKESIIQFCETYIDDFKLRRDFYLVKKPMSFSINKKNKLIDFDNINISKSEFEYIDNLNISYNSKKVIFTLLVEHKKSAKRYYITHGLEYNNTWWGGSSVKYNYLKRVSKIPINCDINYDVFSELLDNHLIINEYKGLVILSFLDNITNDNNIIYNIDDFENVGWYYDLYHNKNKIKRCVKCKSLFKANSNHQIYCSECSTYKPIGLKKVKCIDCGDEFEVDARNMTKIRCDSCYHKYIKKYDRERKKIKN